MFIIIQHYKSRQNSFYITCGAIYIHVQATTQHTGLLLEKKIISAVPNLLAELICE